MLLHAEDEKLIVLDLQNATTKLEFDAKSGMWNDTFNEEAETIESQCFSFVHGAIADWQTWWGCTPSNSADNSAREDYITYQYSNMAKGGIVLNEDGTVKKDEHGAPVVSADVPYMVAFYASYMAKRPVDITFNDGKLHEPVGIYVNLSSWTYYSLQDGCGVARAFTNDDKYTLTFHGVAADETEKTMTVELGSYTNGDLTLTRGWKYVDLSSLGLVNEIYADVKSTDTGEYGDNTPAYFCFDKLIVKEGIEQDAVKGIEGNAAETLSYDRVKKIVSVRGAEFSIVYDAEGNKLMTSEDSDFSISHLPAGVYIVRAGNSSLKIAK